jgi:hypothetical protein
MSDIKKWPPDSESIEGLNSHVFSQERDMELPKAKKVGIEFVSELHNMFGYDVSLYNIVLNYARYRQIKDGDERYTEGPEFELCHFYETTCEEVLNKTNNPYLKIILKELHEKIELLYEINDQLKIN